MVTESQIYWITRMDSFSTAATAVGIIFSIAALIFLIVSVCFWCEEKDCKMFFVALSIQIFCLCIVVGACFIPNTKEMCVIKMLPRIINNEQVQELPQQIVELANEWIEELKPPKEQD